MSEDRTRDLNQPRSIDERFERVEIRITNLEDRQHDTKPIWERALAEIAESRAELKAEIAESRAELKAEIAGLRTEMKTGVDGLRTEMKAEFVNVQHNMEHELRRVGRQIDVLNQTFLQIQADQRYVDRRLEELETQIEQR
jgi:hypothetical protein